MTCPQQLCRTFAQHLESGRPLDIKHEFATRHAPVGQPVAACQRRAGSVFRLAILARELVVLQQSAPACKHWPSDLPLAVRMHANTRSRAQHSCSVSADVVQPSRTSSITAHVCTACCAFSRCSVALVLMQRRTSKASATDHQHDVRNTSTSILRSANLNCAHLWPLSRCQWQCTSLSGTAVPQVQ
jgi:hypothetical protein